MRDAEKFGWMDDASCRDMDPIDIDRLFFPSIDKDNDADYQNARYRRRICGGCPVREECLSWGNSMIEVEILTLGDQDVALVGPTGVYGGDVDNVRTAQRVEAKKKAA